LVVIHKVFKSLLPYLGTCLSIVHRLWCSCIGKQSCSVLKHHTMKVSGSVELETSALISACRSKWSGSLRADKSSLPLLEIELSSLYLLLLTYSVSTQFLKDVVCPGYVLISLHSKYLANCIYSNHTHVFPSFKGFLHKFCAFITDC